MHYLCIWVDKDYVQFGKDPKKWAKKVDAFLDKDTEKYWMIQGQSVILGGRWTGFLKCKPKTGFSLKDVLTPNQLKEEWVLQWAKGIGAFEVDENHCDICDIKDLETELKPDNLNYDFLYGVRFFDKCRKKDPSIKNLKPDEIVDLINKKQIEGLVVVVDFHE